MSLTKEELKYQAKELANDEKIRGLWYILEGEVEELERRVLSHVLNTKSQDELVLLKARAEGARSLLVNVQKRLEALNSSK